MTGKDLKSKLENIGIPLRQVAEKMGISEQNLQNKMSSADIKVSFLCKLSKALHKSIYFFLDGQDFYTEKMLIHSDEVNSEEPTPTINQEFQGAPYYNVDFIGGFDFVVNDQTQHPDYYINYPPYNKPGVLWCNLTGHSMEPELSNGDVIALREVNSPIEYLPAGEIYGIVTDEYRTVKRIRPGHQEGFVRLIPSNKSPEFCEQEIPVDMIRRIYAVLGSIRKFF